MKIIIDGVVGWDVTADNIRDLIKEANGEDINLEISSPGGSVFEGLTIFRLLAKYKKETGAKITADIMSLAASMGSYIPLVADEITVYSTSVFMIHNAWGLAIGNADEIRETADLLENLSGIIMKEYVRKTGKSKEEILDLMGKTAWFYGDEIVEAGFADIMSEDTSEEKPKEDEIEYAKMMVQDAQDKFTAEQRKDDIKKAVALFEPKNEVPVGPLFGEEKMEVKPLTGKQQNKEEDFNMTHDEFLSGNPEARAEYDALIIATASSVRAGVLEILEISGSKISPAAKKTIEDGGDSKDYAVAEIKAQRAKEALVPEEQNTELGAFEAPEAPGVKAVEKSAVDVANKKALEKEIKNLKGGK